VSVVEYNLINEKKLIPADKTAGSRSSADRKQKTHERDIFRRIRTRDICMVARQLATLLRAGMPLVPALSALVEQSRGVQDRDNPLAEVVEQVANDVNSGSTLATALSKHPKVFSNLFINMVAGGISHVRCGTQHNGHIYRNEQSSSLAYDNAYLNKRFYANVLDINRSHGLPCFLWGCSSLQN
jgi:hypothetical protein